MIKDLKTDAHIQCSLYKAMVFLFIGLKKERERKKESVKDWELWHGASIIKPLGNLHFSRVSGSKWFKTYQKLSKIPALAQDVLLSCKVRGQIR